jgi:hypothetical protein
MTPAMLTPHNKSAKSSLEAVHVHRGFRVLGQSTWRHSRRWRQIASTGLPCRVVIAYEALGTRGIAREQTNLKPTGLCATVGCSPRTRCRDHRHRYFGEQGLKDSRSQVQLGLIWAREQGRFPFFLSFLCSRLSERAYRLTHLINYWFGLCVRKKLCHVMEAQGDSPGWHRPRSRMLLLP